VIDPIWVKAVLKALVLPPTGPLLVAVLGLALWRRRPRLGAGLAWTGVLSLLVLSLPAVASLLIRSLDIAAPFDRTRAAQAQAIVILGGGTRRDAPDYGGDTLGTLTLERVRYGARIARLTGLPVLATLPGYMSAPQRTRSRAHDRLLLIVVLGVAAAYAFVLAIMWTSAS